MTQSTAQWLTNRSSLSNWDTDIRDESKQIRESQTTEAFLAHPLVSRDELSEVIGWNTFGFTPLQLSKLSSWGCYGKWLPDL